MRFQIGRKIFSQVKRRVRTPYVSAAAFGAERVIAAVRDFNSHATLKDPKRTIPRTFSAVRDALFSHLEGLHLMRGPF
jgi:aspartate/tyrosine/aromatic aminotransferase